jgi:hypothetical protein
MKKAGKITYEIARDTKHSNREANTVCLVEGGRYSRRSAKTKEAHGGEEVPRQECHEESPDLEEQAAWSIPEVLTCNWGIKAPRRRRNDQAETSL